MSEYGHVTSPNGEMNAYVHEFDSVRGVLTQVMVELYPGSCGAGSVAAYSSGLEFKLSWIDDENIEVLYPAGVETHQKAMSKTVSCFDRSVNVRAIAREQQ